MRKILNKEFFNRSTPIVANDLLGKFLVRKINNKEIAVMITETEAYDGYQDKASHASKGKTERTEAMFDDPGNFYIYLCYGMYWMLNIVTRKHDYPAAVLIRGIHGANGPGKLTKFLNINNKLNNKHAIKRNRLWFEDRKIRIHTHNIKKTPRIGVAYAGPIWSAKKWRFIIKQ